MSLKPMSKQKEQEIASSVNKAAELVSAGTHPNDAIAKVAMDMGYNENIAKYMVNSYNVSKTLARFESESGEKRAEDFSVAKTETVIEKMRATKPAEKQAELPSTKSVKDYIYTGVDAEAFAEKYVSKKVASEADFPDYVLVDRLTKLRDDINCKVALANAEAATDKIVASEQFFKVAELLSIMPAGRFAQFESEAVAKYGKVASILLDSVFSTRDFKALGHTRSVKVASNYFDDTTAEHKEFSTLMSLMDKASESKKIAAEIGSTAENLAVDLSPLVAARGVGSTLTSGTDAVTDFLNKSVLDPMLEKQQGTPKTLDDVKVPLDLRHNFENSGVSGVLSEILGEDEVLKNEDPGEVARIAKQQLEISPDLVNHPAILASAIRRAMATHGDVDPFAAKQLWDFTDKPKPGANT